MGKGGGSGVGSNAIKAGAANFWQSQGARKAVFEQLNSALRTGGGAGFKSGVVQSGVARSLAAGRQALAGASDSLGGADPSVRSRVLNRIMQGTKGEVSRAGPAFAAQLINQAPAALNAAGAGQAGAMQVAAGGEMAGREAASIKAQGWSNAASAVASSLGRAAGSFGGGDTSAPTTVPSAQPGPWSSGYVAPAATPSWYDRFFGGKG
jgi:hypothetical protein